MRKTSKEDLMGLLRGRYEEFEPDRRNIWRTKGGIWLTEVHLEKCLSHVCVCVCV